MILTQQIILTTEIRTAASTHVVRRMFCVYRPTVQLGIVYERLRCYQPQLALSAHWQSNTATLLQQAARCPFDSFKGLDCGAVEVTRRQRYQLRRLRRGGRTAVVTGADLASIN